MTDAALVPTRYGRFPTKAAMRKHYRALLDLSTFGAPLNYEEMSWLLRRHPDADAKFGCGVESFHVARCPPFWSRGFVAVRKDGTTVDFSYNKCLAGAVASPRKPAVRAFRSAIHEQILQFKQRQFHQARVTCAIDGVSVCYRDAEVDHAPPNTFAGLLSYFLHTRGTALKDVQVLQNSDGVTYRLVDAELADAWRNHHSEYAVLRILSPAAHTLVTANDNQARKEAA